MFNPRPRPPGPTFWPHAVLLGDVLGCVPPPQAWFMLLPDLEGSVTFAPLPPPLVEILLFRSLRGLFG